MASNLKLHCIGMISLHTDGVKGMIRTVKTLFIKEFAINDFLLLNLS